METYENKMKAYNNSGDKGKTRPRKPTEINLEEISRVEQFKLPIRNLTEIPANSVPIQTDISRFDFNSLSDLCEQKEGSNNFDVVVMDPPWNITSVMPSRGITLNYETMSDYEISQIQMNKVQTNGVLFLWVVNAKRTFARE